jgi:hypothetical protein
MAGTRALVVAALLLLSVAAVVAVPRQAPTPLPAGEAVIARYVAATGGQAAYDAIRNRVIHAKMELVDAGITFTLTVYQEKPDRIFTHAESSATGPIDSGVVDGIAWENSSLRGAVVKDGRELADSLRDAWFDRVTYWRKAARSVECVAAEDVDGKPAYKVVMTPNTGSPITIYFDRASGLIVKFETVTAGQGGSTPVVSRPGDYRQAGGIKAPFSSRVTAGGERLVSVERIEQNVELPPDRFAPPAAVKALIDAKKK